ncbi:MAG: UDP-N-acetylmuramoyl-L-alanyl-D-glutamate--2,6-diaminopimelate ligase [Planctomycetota bacterium]|jgi:UDP-N-acetylmuramoyl-L-alanyl-D-glutamate--2,6-diaminopimelate ligase|nr:UDP-N-acetylmuramoyl-L-alanyl-D-glutamate--2,6-diaminopimelate ligase [Planctomycetota bacterium]
MRLADLVREIPGATLRGDPRPEALDISPDSREVGPGFIFASIAGHQGKGRDYLDNACQRGAVAVLSSQDNQDTSLPLILVADPRRALGEAAAALQRHPARDLALLGITGTNGKTSTAYILRHLLRSLGQKVGMLGTIEYDLGGGETHPAPLTTPDAASFTRHLASMRGHGCQWAVVEVSSHALDQWRVWPHPFRGAIFTNLTRDHLDYHGSMENYLAAKQRLFLGLEPTAAAVFNWDDPAAPSMAKASPARCLGFSLLDTAKTGENQVRVEVSQSSLTGQTCRLEGAGLTGSFQLPLIGQHNVYNAVGAVLLLHQLGLPFPALAQALSDFPGVPGRLERLTTPRGASVFVDYAHTDDALRSVLKILRPLTRGRLITVFGCGGERDRGKRPLMARAAEDGSDRVVVTSDNPRTENPEQIFTDILAGFSNPKSATLIPEREQAVAWAVAAAEEGDAVLLAGKGHENYQIRGEEKVHLDDRELVRDACRRLGA